MTATHPTRTRKRDHEARERRELAELRLADRLERQHRAARPATTDGATVVALPGAALRQVMRGGGGPAEMVTHSRRLSSGQLFPRPAAEDRTQPGVRTA